MKSSDDRNNRIRARIISFGFAGLLVLLLLLSAALPDRTFSENENRSLTARPAPTMETVASGKFMRQFESWASDQIVCRDGWVAAKTRTDMAALRKDNGRVYFGREGYLFQIETLDEQQLDKNIGYVEAFFRQAKEKRPQMRTSMIAAPTSAEVVPSLLPRYAPVPDERAAAERIGRRLGADFCDVLPALLENSQSYLYYRTDHHWTTLGAYFAYAAWSAAPPPAAAYKVTTVADDFYGTAFSKAGVKGPADRIDRFDLAAAGSVSWTMQVWEGKEATVFRDLYDEAYLTGKDKYGYFLGGNHPLTVIERQTQEPPRTILVLKDSYANCFIPFLTAEYDRIVAVDLRYYKQSPLELAEEYNADELLVLYNIIGFSNDRNLIYLKGDA